MRIPSLIICTTFLLLSNMTFAQHWIREVHPKTYSNAINKYFNIQISFSTDIDAYSLNNQSIIVNGDKSGRHFVNNFSYSHTLQKTRFKPKGNFIIGENVTVIITNLIKSINGISMPNSYLWSFRIAPDGGIGNFYQDTSISIASGYGGKLVSADFDLDNDLDLAFTDIFSGNLAFLKNNGNGKFNISDSINILAPTAITCSDFDNNGAPDIAIASNTQYPNLWILINDGTGRFIIHPDTIEFAGYISKIISQDMNGDGCSDLLVVDRGGLGPGSLQILINDGTGNFEEILPGIFSGSFWEDCALGDWDLDGDIDFVATSSCSTTSGATSIYKNDGRGNFSLDSNAPSPEFPGYVASLNADNDDDLDIIVTSSKFDYSYILLNNDSSFSYTQIPISGLPLTFDWEFDLDIDLILANFQKMRIYFAENFGNANFSVFDSLNVSEGIISLDYGDWDSDGDLDMASLSRDPNYTTFNLKIFLNENLSTIKEHHNPQDFLFLSSSYPNPFNSSTTIDYYLQKKSFVEAVIFDISGRKIIKLHEAEELAGLHKITWNGLDSRNVQVTSGIYIYQFRIESSFYVGKIVYLN